MMDFYFDNSILKKSAIEVYNLIFYTENKGG